MIDRRTNVTHERLHRKMVSFVFCASVTQCVVYYYGGNSEHKGVRYVLFLISIVSF